MFSERINKCPVDDLVLEMEWSERTSLVSTYSVDAFA